MAYDLGMELNHIIFTLIIGAISGWLAGVIRDGYGFGVIGNIVVGIVGAFVGSFLLRAIGVSLGAGVVGYIITAVIGALVLLAIIGFFTRSASRS